MSLTPKGIDLEQVKALIEEAENDIQDLQRKYSVSTLDELQALSDNYYESKRNVSLLENELKSVLGETNWEALEAENGTIPKDISSVKDIDLKIHELCGSATIDEFIGGNEAVLSGYKSKYDNEDELENSIKSLEDRINESQEKLDRLDNVPEKFAEIKDPDEHDSKYKKDIDDYDKKIDELNINIQNVFRNMDEKSAEEYAEELQQKEEILKASKAEYMHWQSIYTVFSRLKENTAGNPVEDIEEKFREYLEMISDGGLKLNAIDEQLSVKLASGNHELTYDILSEGTKDTIALAFRLAMLEHLYPDGDGLAIFDDPFTDMDPKRVEVSCKLIQKYAEKNQVIFITCDEKYKKLMPNGNIIKVSK
jgi:uncharacterized protein YhaN